MKVSRSDGDASPILLQKERARSRPIRLRGWYLLHHHLPPKITQSPCDVPMKSNMGSDNQVLVREAMNAWRASSGAAGGPPVSAAMPRLLFGQIIPQTFSSMRMP